MDVALESRSVLAFFPGMSGGGEILVIFLVILLLFGSKRIPEVARGLARGLHEFRKATREIMDEVQSTASETAPPRRPGVHRPAPSRSAETPAPQRPAETPHPPAETPHPPAG